MAARVSRRQLAQAARLFEGFRERDVGRLKTHRVRVPDVAVAIGKLTAAEYVTTHGAKRVRYRHEFKPHAAPELLVTPDGRQLLILGGKFRFTARGIVDRPRR